MNRAMLLAAFLAMIVAGVESVPSRAAAGEEPPRTTIAVFDFANRSPGDGNDWLGKGLADMAITDLAASGRLVVVDRERMQEIARELELGAAGIVDPAAAPHAGRLAKAEWVLFGTFLRSRGRLSLEAILIDAAGEHEVRIEQVEGPWEGLFGLEESLVGAVLAKLDVPMTAEELRTVKLLKTRSLPAFEHYSRSLLLFDRGDWYDALREARLARRADSDYLMAGARVAQLYHEVGEPEHALVEYRRLVTLDRENSLPDEVYFRMAVVLDEATADRAGATAILQRLLRRYEELRKPFLITDPAQPSRGWEHVGGKTAVDKLADEYRTRLRTLACLARWQLQAGEPFEAARSWSQIAQFLHTHGMPFGHESLGVGVLGQEGLGYSSLYWKMVRENRDASLYPAGILHLVSDAETVDASSGPTHGYYQWQGARIWLAPPGREFADVDYTAGEAGLPGASAGKPQDVQFDFSSPEGYHSLLFKIVKVKPDASWQKLRLDPGIRAIQTYVFHSNQWRMRFRLRPWTKPAQPPEIAGLQVNVLPQGAELLLNGQSKGNVQQGLSFVRIPAGRYEVEARWPDGRNRSASVELAEGRRMSICLNADLVTVSRQVLAPSGSNTCLVTDRRGRVWLVWDEFLGGDIMRVNKESDLLCASSSDGMVWSRPRRLPASSLGCDMAPILCQDRRGVFWLVWISDRGPKAEKNVWIASSPNGVEWSFPRKVALPEEVQQDLPRWRESRLPSLAFTIDRRNVYWLVWQGWLLSSDDAAGWRVDSMLRTSADNSADNFSDKYYHLDCDVGNRLVLVAQCGGGLFGAKLWRRGPRGDWEPLEWLTDRINPAWHLGSTACRADGKILAVIPDGDLSVRQLDPSGAESKPIVVESYLTNPIHPSIAPLPGGRTLLAFGSTEGLVALVIEQDRAAGAASGPPSGGL